MPFYIVRSDYFIRPARQDDEPFLWEMLYEAFNAPGGETPLPRDVIYQPDVRKYVEGWGEPDDLGFVAVDRDSRQAPYQFQWWALGLVGARPTEQKKGADKGIDGRLYFHDEPGGKTKQIILSVKAGANLQVSHVRDLRGVVEREKAEIGVLISLEEPTNPMRSEAASAGFYKTPYGNHPRLQILTIEQLLEGARIDYPPQYARTDATFKRAPKAKPKGAAQLPLVAETQDNYPDE